MIIETIAVMAVLQVLLAAANAVSCLWDHNTRELWPWILSGLGWFVVMLQMIKRIMDGETR